MAVGHTHAKHRYHGMNDRDRQHRELLQDIARRAMVERGLLPDFEPEVQNELGEITASALDGDQVRDLRSLLWCSIDNDDSRDLDQLTVAEPMPDYGTKVLVAVADVAATVRSGSAIDGHARHNTTSVYTAARIFPMLPEKLSTDITSLGFGEDRLAVVVEMVLGSDGSLQDSAVYRAQVRNRAKLAYNAVAAWLDGGAVPKAVADVHGEAAHVPAQHVGERQQGFVCRRQVATVAASGHEDHGSASTTLAW